MLGQTVAAGLVFYGTACFPEGWAPCSHQQHGKTPVILGGVQGHPTLVLIYISQWPVMLSMSSCARLPSAHLLGEVSHVFCLFLIELVFSVYSRYQFCRLCGLQMSLLPVACLVLQVASLTE